MQRHAGGGFGIGPGWLLMEEQDQGSSLPQLILDRASANGGLGLNEELRGEVGAIGREGTGQGTHPAARAMVPSIRETP